MVRVRSGWGFFLPNPKVRVGWIGNPTQPKTFHNPIQPNPLFSGWVVKFFLKVLFIHIIIIRIQSYIKYIKSSQTNTNQSIIIDKKKINKKRGKIVTY